MSNQRCSNNRARGEIDGYKCTIDLSMDYAFCECKDFKYRRAKKNEYCKHLDELYMIAVCPWGILGEEVKQTKEQEENHICPLCGGGTLKRFREV